MTSGRLGVHPDCPHSIVGGMNLECCGFPQKYMVLFGAPHRRCRIQKELSRILTLFGGSRGDSHAAQENKRRPDAWPGRWFIFGCRSGIAPAGGGRSAVAESGHPALYRDDVASLGNQRSFALNQE
ncbi:MAG: hypothetical protein ACOC0P_03765 [Planctomycetota bacterium]